MNSLNQILKVTIVLTLSLLVVTGCGKDKKLEKKEDTIVVDHRWTDKNKLDFERNCVGFLESEGVEKAKVYCDCLLESSIASYPDPQMALDLEQNDIVKLFEESKCLDDLLLIKIEDPWTEEVEQLFLQNCNEAQKEQGVDPTDSDAYCSCALQKVKEIIPNPNHVLTLTEDELNGILEKCKP